MSRIMIVGSSNIDMVATMQRMPARGETVQGTTTERIPGGKGANQAYACGKLGASAVFVSMVGDDGLGETIIGNMQSVGVETHYIGTAEGTATGTAFIWVDEAGNNSIVVIPGANAKCDSAYINSCSPAMKDSSIVIAQLETPAEGIYHCLRAAATQGKMIILNPAPAPNSIPDDILALLDYITPNETELQKLTGATTDNLKSVEQGCRVLLDKGVKNVLVTLGFKGAMLVNQRECTVYAPPTVRVVDTTAAGDTFNAAFAVKILEGSTPGQAIIFANAASSLAVSRKGAQTSIPYRQEVEQFIQTLNTTGKGKM